MFQWAELCSQDCNQSWSEMILVPFKERVSVCSSFRFMGPKSGGNGWSCFTEILQNCIAFSKFEVTFNNEGDLSLRVDLQVIFLSCFSFHEIQCGFMVMNVANSKKSFDCSWGLTVDVPVECEISSFHFFLLWYKDILIFNSIRVSFKRTTLSSFT